METTTIENYIKSLELPAKQGLDLVSALQRNHLAKYAFSSINAMQAEQLSLEQDALFKRVIVDKQGGYCFEHNKIAYLALQQLGFNVRPVLARVTLNGTMTNPRTHRMTLLTLEDRQYLVDVGFGVKSPRIPLDIDLSCASEGSNSYRIEREQDIVKIILQEANETPVQLYQVELSEIFEGDCEVAHFYSHQHPEASFVNNLVVSRIDAQQRFLLRNQKYFVWDESKGTCTEQAITDFAHLQTLVRDIFWLDINEEKLKSTYDKVITRALNKPS
ncbi:arylamine N-acetyltransferase family protein [Pseudoalteromonas sp. T1lg65]|uniref:arylamine N-acetyltransferase family protein n=1 Tax=Pseudoalteromonas sp. T1lg65 TaxID=2077101 RepID=UPI003F78D97F